MKLLTLLKDLPAHTLTGSPQVKISHLECDSRRVLPGSCYIALKGTQADGHEFIPEAIRRGACAVVAEMPCTKEARDAGVSWVEVNDSRLAVSLMGAAWNGHPSRHMTMIGVTGTNGKTTTAYIAHSLLKQSWLRAGLIGTIAYDNGEEITPSTHTTPGPLELEHLLKEMFENGCRGVSMEVSSHALDQERVAGINFNVGIFTNLTQDHLDYHGSMEAYRQAKGLLFRQCRRAVLNLDDPAGRWYGERVECPAFTYSENKDAAGLTAKNIRLFPGHVEFEAVSREEIQRIHLPIPGGFTIYNALAAVSCGLCLGLTLAEIAASLRSAKGVRGRVEVVPVPTAYTVLIDYAHTPNALENVLLTARDFTAGRLICLFGCGGDRDRTKRPIMGGVVRELADVAVITSDNPRTEEPWAIIRDILAGMGGPGGEVHVEPDRKQAIRWALAQGRPGDVIVLAGKGHETVQEVQGVSLPLDEREVVAEYFEKRAQYRERAGNLPAGVV